MPKTPAQLDAEIAEALATPKAHAARFADLQRQGFMRRSPVQTWVVAVEAASGDPSEATYIEVRGKTEAAALRAAQARKPGARLTVRYAK
jgi:multidrug resistance efflux pump